MTQRLTLIAHTSTPALRTAAFAADEALDDDGRARATAATPPPVGRHVCGPERRAVETAALLGLDAAVDAALRDLDCGRWTGLPLAAVAGAEPDALGTWRTDPAASPHGGESIAALVERAGTWLAAVVAGDPHRIVAVTHPAVIRAAAVVALRATPESFWHLDVEPLSATRLHRHDGRWTLRSFNSPLDPRPG